MLSANSTSLHNLCHAQSALLEQYDGQQPTHRLTCHIVLVGLPGAGKSTVGPLLAKELGLRFLDIDNTISELTGQSVIDIFKTMGEDRFRELESHAVAEALISNEPAVISPGGGWAVTGSNLADVQGRALTVYLWTSADVAVKRIRGGVVRPVLEPDPAVQMAELLRRRDPIYGLASLIRNTDNIPPDEIAREIAALARKSDAW